MTVKELIDMLLEVDDKSMQVYIPLPNIDGTIALMESCPGISGVVEFEDIGVEYKRFDGDEVKEEDIANAEPRGFVIYSHQFHSDADHVNPQQN